jgi:cyclopropane-fatty-acyl-phospholipid synthase
LYHLEDIGDHYALTLKAWRHNFFKNIEQVKTLGFSDKFVRMWEFYLCYCEGGFRERWISDVQLVLTKPECRIQPIVMQSEHYAA